MLVCLITASTSLECNACVYISKYIFHYIRYRPTFIRVHPISTSMIYICICTWASVVASQAPARSPSPALTPCHTHTNSPFSFPPSLPPSLHPTPLSSLPPSLPPSNPPFLPPSLPLLHARSLSLWLNRSPTHSLTNSLTRSRMSILHFISLSCISILYVYLARACLSCIVCVKRSCHGLVVVRFSSSVTYTSDAMTPPPPLFPPPWKTLSCLR